MVESTQNINDAHEVHRTSTFDKGVKALLAVLAFGGVGTVLGHYLGRFGEDSDHKGKGMSTSLGRWIGGVGLGALAAYVSLKEAANHDQERAALEARNAELEARLKQAEAPTQQVQTATSEHRGSVAAPNLEHSL